MRSSRIPPFTNGRSYVDLRCSVYHRLRKAQPCSLREWDGRTWKKLERAKGFEPSTPTLARSCSTPELHPHPLGMAAVRRQSFHIVAVRIAKTTGTLQPRTKNVTKRACT